MERPAVTVIAPFAGSAAHAAEMLEALAALRTGEGDRIVVADNSVEGVLGRIPVPDRIEVVPAPRERSSYYARNVAAARASSDWLLFCDSDVTPPGDLLDRYFEPPVGERVGIVAGAVAGAGGGTPAARYATSRGQIDERFHLVTGPRPAGVTANLLVRRVAWEQVGGFHEGIRSGGDLVFCWRVQELGWRLEHRPEAEVVHRHPDDVAAMLAKARRHAAGRAWVNGLYPGALPRPRVLRPFLRGPLVAAWWLLRGDRERAAFKLLDMRWAAAMISGYYRGDNAAPPGTR